MKQRLKLGGIALLMLLGFSAFALGINSVAMADIKPEGQSTGEIGCSPQLAYIPIRQTMEGLGYSVEWFGEAQKVKVVGCNNGYEFKVGSKTAVVDRDMIIELQDPVIIEHGTACLSVRSAQQLGIPCDNVVENNTKGSLAYRLNNCFDQNENYVFSPLSFKSALAMAANGGEGKTKEEILKVLGYSSLQELNSNMRQLNEVYSAKGDITLSGANSVWVNKRLPDLSKDFENELKEGFDADCYRVSPSELSVKVKKWVDEKSRGMQKDFGMAADKNFALALVNTTYLKADWANEFEGTATHKADFTDSNGSVTQTEFMHDTAERRAYVDDKVTMVRLPYRDGEGGRELSFYAAMAPEGCNYEEYIEKLENREVALSLPKFKGHSKVSLKEAVQSLGASEMFTGKADFSKMFDEPTQVFVSSIMQDTVIEVDEKGTEAASTTAIMMGCTNAYNSIPPLRIDFNKPFTYFIRDDKSGEILFMGRFAKAE